jgi:mycothiol system anti-sigma-R factor
MSPRHISCEELLQQLFDYLDRQVDEGARADIDQHLERCRDCFSRVEFETRLRARVGAAGTQKAPERLHRRVKAILEKF